MNFIRRWGVECLELLPAAVSSRKGAPRLSFCRWQCGSNSSAAPTETSPQSQRERSRKKPHPELAGALLAPPPTVLMQCVVGHGVPSRRLSVGIDPVHRALQGELVGFVFAPKTLLELGVMGGNIAFPIFGSLTGQGILGNPPSLSLEPK
jgi:hypothetical protein